MVLCPRRDRRQYKVSSPVIHETSAAFRWRDDSQATPDVGISYVTFIYSQ